MPLELKCLEIFIIICVNILDKKLKLKFLGEMFRFNFLHKSCDILLLIFC